MDPDFLNRPSVSTCASSFMHASTRKLRGQRDVFKTGNLTQLANSMLMKFLSYLPWHASTFHIIVRQVLQRHPEHLQLGKEDRANELHSTYTSCNTDQCLRLVLFKLRITYFFHYVSMSRQCQELKVRDGSFFFTCYGDVGCTFQRRLYFKPCDFHEPIMSKVSKQAESIPIPNSNSGWHINKMLRKMARFQCPNYATLTSFPPYISWETLIYSVVSLA